MPANQPAPSEPENPLEEECEASGNPLAEDLALDDSTDAELGAEPIQVDAIPKSTEETLKAEVDEAKDRLLRTQAELENYRKRAARQMDEQRRYADLPLLRELLPVWDNMGRAIEAAEKDHKAENLLEGFKMVMRQLEEVLARHHCTEMQAMDGPFDPHLHEAVFQQPSAGHPPGTVIGVTQTGFQLHDRVVRPSKVIVSVAEPEPAEGDAENSAEDGTPKDPTQGEKRAEGR